MSREVGKWNGIFNAVVIRHTVVKGVPHVVVQVESVPAMGRGKAFEQVIVVPTATWRAANPTKGD